MTSRKIFFQVWFYRESLYSALLFVEEMMSVIFDRNKFLWEIGILSNFEYKLCSKKDKEMNIKLTNKKKSPNLGIFDVTLCNNYVIFTLESEFTSVFAIFCEGTSFFVECEGMWCDSKLLKCEVTSIVERECMRAHEGNICSHIGIGIIITEIL